MNVVQSRQAHAVLDMPSRRLKAMKIERLLGLDQGTVPICMLEVGCGSGGISHYFGTHPSARFEVHAVDVTDSRLVFDAYDFRTVLDTELPYPDARFDVVLSNHVIEHVGDEAAQIRHLRELKRVLKPGGVGYLAAPNRWMLIEPHYRLIFLSWLPYRWRNSYLKIMRGKDFYDCNPLILSELKNMFCTASLQYEIVSVEALYKTIEIENIRWPFSMLRWAPRKFLDFFNSIIPTLIFLLRK
jgi:SAM-dependent methyltransferase